jgi:rRNA maturation RNase YbeY
VRRALGPKENAGGEVCVFFATDAEARKLNKRFLGEDRPTDVIAFNYPAARTSAGENAPFGDIVIGLGAARRQASELGHGLLREMLILAAHGALHLAGFDDKTAEGREAMSVRQEEIADGLLPSKRASGGRADPRSGPGRPGPERPRRPRT